MARISAIGVTLIVCLTLPALAQAPPANTITCSSATACKKGNIPIFASNGGAAKVDDSIIKQSGSTISVAGSETVTTNISAGGNVTATGNLSGANVSASSNVTGGVVSATTSFDTDGAQWFTIRRDPRDPVRYVQIHCKKTLTRMLNRTRNCM